MSWTLLFRIFPAVNSGEKIHSAKIAGHTLTQIMDVVELDHVIVGEVATIVPVEANRDCSVVEVRYLIVFDQNVVSVAHQNAKAHGSHSATTGDQVVPEVDALWDLGIGVASENSASHANAARTRVEHHAVPKLRQVR